MLGHEPGGDFLQFYVAGKTLNEYPHALLYDLPFEYQLEHSLRPALAAGSMLANANSPFIALLFRPLARLPYLWAYGAWLVISSALYVSGVALLWPKGEEFDGISRTVLLVCLSFMPFSIECWFGGQISAIGFIALALSIRCQKTGRPFAGGVALALCTYKPTLLVLLVPMLAIGRRFRTLLGFVVGAFAASLLSLAAAGYEGCAAYLRRLMLYAHFTAADTSHLRSFKYVDIGTFFRLLLGGHSYAGLGIALALTGVAFACLAAGWARARVRLGPEADLLWAATIAWTLVFNIYVPIYDTVLIVISALVTAGVLYRSKHIPAARPDIQTFHALLIVLYITAWVTQVLASVIRLQVLTLVLAAIGGFELRLSARSARSAEAMAGS